MTQVPANIPISGVPFREVIQEGDWTFTGTVTIPRQFKQIESPVTTYERHDSGQKDVMWRAGQVAGAGKDRTRLRFPKVTGACIETEDFKNHKDVSQFWNHNNTQGDTSKRCNLHPSVEDLTIIGSAHLANYPATVPFPAWDPEGKLWHKNHPRSCDGLRLRGSGARASRIRLWQIPGIGIVLTVGDYNAHSGVFGLLDGGLQVLEDVEVFFALDGVEIATTDAKARHIECAGIGWDAIILSGNAIYLDNHTAHVQNCDRALVCRGAGNHVLGGYWEAARVAVHVEGSGHGTQLTAVDSKNGTCWQRNYLLEADTDLTEFHCDVHPVGHWPDPTGEIYAAKGTAGIEIGEGRRCTVRGRVLMHVNNGWGEVSGKNTSDGMILRGDRCVIDLNGGWHRAERPKGAYVKVVGDKRVGNRITVRGNGADSTNSGTSALVDLTLSKLDKHDGEGTRIEIWWNAGDLKSMLPVRYPGGGTEYNLYWGTKVYVNGRRLGPSR